MGNGNFFIYSCLLIKMNKKEWQLHNGFTDEEMNKIETLLKLFNGKITKILDKKNLSDILTKEVKDK